MYFANVIEAIKTLRNKFSGTLELSETDVSQPCVVIRALGLKEAKDFVEACMELGVARYKESLAKSVEKPKLGNTSVHYTRPDSSGAHFDVQDIITCAIRVAGGSNIEWTVK